MQQQPQRTVEVELPWLLGGTQRPHEGTQRWRRGSRTLVAIIPRDYPIAKGGLSGRRGRHFSMQFKQIFSNNKRKVLY